jgi:hypothetical protein
LVHIPRTAVFFFVVTVNKDIFAGVEIRSNRHITEQFLFVNRIVGVRLQNILFYIGPWQQKMVKRQCTHRNQQRCNKIRPRKPVKTGTTADNSNNLGIVGHPGREENNGYKNQNRHKGQNQIQNPERIKIQQKITYGKTVAFYPGCFGLHIHHQNNNRQQRQHKNEGSQIFFDHVEVYDFHRLLIAD